uniref:HMG box domain-containing protein n=1 Tax=Glycine max TaxID=3847 RepID=I1JLG9_SOYBN
MKNAKGKGAARASKESLKPVDDRKVGKRKASGKPGRSSAPKKEKKAKKDPNKPKRPPSAFFVFLEEFRKTFKAENPNVKAVSVVGKAGGEKWKSLSSAVSFAIVINNGSFCYLLNYLTLHCFFSCFQYKFILK